MVFHSCGINLLLTAYRAVPVGLSVLMRNIFGSELHNELSGNYYKCPIVLNIRTLVACGVLQFSLQIFDIITLPLIDFVLSL